MELSRDEIRLEYECRFDPAALRPSDPLVDLDGDSTVSQHERADFCVQAAQYLASDLIVFTSGTQCVLREESFFMFDDGSGFRSVFAGDMPPLSGKADLFLIDPSFIPFGAAPAADGSTTTSGYARAAGNSVRLLGTDDRPRETVPLPRDMKTILRIEVKPPLEDRSAGGNKQTQT